MIDWGKKVEDRAPVEGRKGFAMISGAVGPAGPRQRLGEAAQYGTFQIFSGGADLGTDSSSHLQMISGLVPLDRVTVTSGDTDSCTFDTGAFASSGVLLGWGLL